MKKKKKKAGASARGDFKVKEFECEFFNFCLGLFKVAPQPGDGRREFGAKRARVCAVLSRSAVRACVLRQPREDTSRPHPHPSAALTHAAIRVPVAPRPEQSSPQRKGGRRPAFGDPGRRGRAVTEGNRGFPSLRRGREEDPGAGNGLDECVISVENSTFFSHEPICSAATMQRLTPGCVCPSRRDTRTTPPGPHLLFPPKLRRRRKEEGGCDGQRSERASVSCLWFCLRL